MRRSRLERPAPGFSIVELLIVVGILAILVAIIAPSLSSAKFVAYRADCGNNLKNTGIATHTYAGENEHQLPTLFRQSQPFTTYLMRTSQSGDVNLGILAMEKGYAPSPHAFYCASQEKTDNASVTYNGPDNRWDSAKFRSSYPARLIEIDGNPMPAGTKISWNTIQYGLNRIVVYSDFLGVDGLTGGDIAAGILRAPHRGRGYNRLFGDGTVRWTEPGPLTKQVGAAAPTAEQQVQYYKELDRLP